MGHKFDRLDVFFQVDRYRKLTGDTNAGVSRTDAGTVTVYEMEGRLAFRLIGAAAAYVAIKSYNDGFEDGKEAAQPGAKQ